ncbi:MAG TPA: hypothetical protein VF885_22190 [Arthrobacter sp.]
MSVVTTIAASQLSWNHLNDLAHSSTNRRLLTDILHAENACIAGAPSSRISDNRTVAVIVGRAIQNGWDDVLEAAATSRHMTFQDHASILRCGKLFAKEVYTGILNSPAAASPAILSMLRNSPYPAVRESVEVKRTAIVIEAIEAARTDPEAYAVEDGDEHPEVFQAANLALALGRTDLLSDLVATGCTGALTAERISMTRGRQLQAA